MSATVAMVDTHRLTAALSGNAFWESYIVSAVASRAARVHLAVFVEPFLSYVLDGSKTVESRFTKRATPPYRRVSQGDVLLVKRAGGPVEAVCRAADVWFYELEPRAWTEIRNRFAVLMRTPPDYLNARSAAAFATLIRIDEMHRIAPLAVHKRDLRGWVILHDPLSGKTRHNSSGSIQLTLEV